MPLTASPRGTAGPLTKNQEHHRERGSALASLTEIMDDLVPVGRFEPRPGVLDHEGQVRSRRINKFKLDPDGMKESS